MTDTKNYMTQYVIAGVIGLAFIGYQTQAKNSANNVGNLPATNANVEKNTLAISNVREQLSAAIQKEAELIRAEINRRELEMTKYVDTLDKKKLERVDGLERRLERDETILMQHMNTPAAAHIRGD